MRITPLDIRNQPFPPAFRGYNRDAVRSFLQHLAGEYETIIRQNDKFATEMKGLEQVLAKYRETERMLNETLMMAQTLSDRSKVEAQKEAELIIDDAHIRAKSFEAEARHRVNMLESEIMSIRNQRDSFLARFKAMLSTQLELLEVISGDLRSDDKDENEKPRQEPPPARLPRPQQQQQRAPIIRNSGFGDDDTIDDVPPQPVILA
ncbi:MAG: DivIVA domain-containing protein [Chitinispirillales bacterium]|jgi:cell division initiation protein|nr:DivIVA domain-containing protein [Chitinispirillales bacterium]